MIKIFYSLLICSIFIFLFGCNKKNVSINYNPPILETEESSVHDSKGQVIIHQQENIILIDTQTQVHSNYQTDTKKINYNSRLEIKSVSVTSPDGEIWFIGKKLDEKFVEQVNTIISTNIFGISFGPINGIEDNQLRIGWNNQNRVLYIEVLSDKVMTADGVVLGDTKEKILSIFGPPYIEENRQFRYQNDDFEIAGILFQFENNIVVKIFLFGYV
jgi:hypothetical protein